MSWCRWRKGTAHGQRATGETGNNNYVNVDAPTGSVNHANNIVVHNSATYRVLKPSVLPYTPTGAEASADGVVVDATGAMIAKKHWTRLVGELREAEDKLGDLQRKKGRSNEIASAARTVETLKDKIHDGEEMISGPADTAATGAASTGATGPATGPATARATGHAAGGRRRRIPAPETVPAVDPTVACEECACDVKTDQVLFEEVRGHKFCYCASASFVTKRRRCIGPLPTDKKPACRGVCAADEQPLGRCTRSRRLWVERLPLRGQGVGRA